MVIMRVEWQIKPGRMQEALAALKKLSAHPRRPRLILRSKFGQMNRIAYDMELQNLDEWDKLNADLIATPLGAEFWKAWNEVVAEGTLQVWTPIDI